MYVADTILCLVVNCRIHFFAEEPKGMDYLWFIGDNFTAKSYRAHFKLNTKQHFIKQNFEFTAYVNSKFSNSNGNMLARLQNTFASALNQSKKCNLPNYVIIVLDDDLITYLNFNKEGAATLMGSWIEWLVKQFKELIATRLSQLPPKAKKFTPFLYWVNTPTHALFSSQRNKLRIKFNLSLESVIRSEKDMRVIKLKEHWNSKDSTLVVKDRITEEGMSAYWNAVDATFQYNMSKRELYIAKSFISEAQQQQQNRDIDQSKANDRATTMNPYKG